MRRVTKDELRVAMKRVTLVVSAYDHKEDEPQNRDEVFAHALVNGVYIRPPDGKISHQFQSANTNPTEQEARLAVARILLSDRVPHWLLKGLAGLFAPDPEQPGRTVVFKKATKSRANLRMSLFIATLVELHRADGCIRRSDSAGC